MPEGREGKEEGRRWSRGRRQEDEKIRRECRREERHQEEAVPAPTILFTKFTHAPNKGRLLK
jgi:hypothetical protein